MASKKGYDQNGPYLGDRNIQQSNIGDLCTDHMQVFGANINLMRHIPNLNDGLKPGERRLLYAMYLLGLKDTGRTVKVAKITGDTIGSLHPHGDSSVYESLVKLGQHWNNIEPLIFPQGNFGSPKGDSAAASRYIEAKFTKYAWKCFFEEFDLSYVSTKPNYSGDMLEPEYFPARYPNTLINNAFGIGYGIATGIPTYNLREVLELTLKLLRDPYHADCTLVPDSPTGAHIVDEGQFTTISETGQGTFKQRAVIDVDEEKNHLIITSLPFQVSGNSLIYNHDARKKKEKKVYDITALMERNELPGLADIEDASGEDGVRIVLILKPEVDPYVVREIIYAKTALEKSITVNFKLIDDYRDSDYNIRTILLDWLDFRRETKRIQFNRQLVKSMERRHILEILLMVIGGKNGEKTIASIRKAESRDAIVDILMTDFKITSLQAKTIANMRMSTFSKEGVKKLEEEKKALDKVIDDLQKKVRSPKKVDKIIEKELQEGIELFGKPRKSKIITLDNEEKIRDTDHVVVFTVEGMVKKLPIDAPTIGAIAAGDYPHVIQHVNNKENLLVFDESGKVTKLTVSDILNHELDSVGEPLSTYISVNGCIASVIPQPRPEHLDAIAGDVFFTMVSKNGLIKKTNALNFTGIKNELIAMIIKDKEDDRLVDVHIMIGEKDLIVYTSKGFGSRFSSTEVRETARMSVGVKAIDLKDGESVTGVDSIDVHDEYFFCLTTKGTGKKMALSSFKTDARGSRPVRMLTLAPTEDVRFVRSVKGTELVQVFLTSSLEQIDLNKLNPSPKLSKGSKLIPVRKGETIIDLKLDQA